MVKELPDEVTAAPGGAPGAVLDRVFELTVRLAEATQRDQAAGGSPGRGRRC